MLRLRLQRRGKKNFATYRVVVADQRAPVKGRFVADVGFYNPHTDEFKVKADKVTAWISKGVQPTATIHNLLVTNNIIKGEKVTSWRPKPKKKDKESDDSKQKPAPEAKSDAAAQKPAEDKKDDKKEAAETPEETPKDKKE